MGTESSDETYKVTVIGDGMSVERSVDQTAARQILNVILGGQAAPFARSSGRAVDADVLGPESVAGGEATRISLREFIEDCGAQRNPDQILAIGEYMNRHEGAQDFGRDEVKARFRTAGEPVPGNYPRDFAWTIKNGWIAEDPTNAGRFYVTKKGKDAIAQKFSSEIRKASAQKTLTRRRARRAANADVETEAVE